MSRDPIDRAISGLDHDAPVVRQMTIEQADRLIALMEASLDRQREMVRTLLTFPAGPH